MVSMIDRALLLSTIRSIPENKLEILSPRFQPISSPILALGRPIFVTNPQLEISPKLTVFSSEELNFKKILLFENWYMILGSHYEFHRGPHYKNGELGELHLQLYIDKVVL